jgi:mRNA-degrading endonuclease RelE of RelBE toxin-antitoxin system
MTVSFKNKALKDLKLIPENRKKQIIDLLFNDIPQFDNIKEIKDIAKIKSFNNYYRIRKGEY